MTTMGGQASKAHHACMTDKTVNYSASGDITGKGLSAGAKISKSYDVNCVETLLSGSKK